MLLLNDLYTIQNIQTLGEVSEVRICLGGQHFIYAAHFPGNPITPGVCIIQIAKELAKTILNKNFLIRIIRNVKYVNVINPDEFPNIVFKIELTPNGNQCYDEKVIVSYGETIFTKLHLHLIPDN